METNQKPTSLSHSLEDYLETIYLLLRGQKLARVKDIAKARGVKASSVTPAMKRLAEQGLVDYNQHEYIDLTPEGADLARRTLARHEILKRFFLEILGLDEAKAEADACSMEHHLSDEGMDRLVRLFEFLARCPQGHDGFLERFHHCSEVHPELPPCSDKCQREQRLHNTSNLSQSTLANLKPGEKARISQVLAEGAIRQRLLDMGMLPGVEVILERFAPAGDPLWIRTEGFQLSLRRAEAAAILVTQVQSLPEEEQ